MLTDDAIDAVQTEYEDTMADTIYCPDPDMGAVFSQARAANWLREEIVRRTVVWHTEPPPPEAGTAYLVCNMNIRGGQLSTDDAWRPGWRWCTMADARRALGIEEG